MQSIEVMVVGGGASGMMAAITAAESGAKVLLVEKLGKVGKKLLATGNGRCNFTNLKQKKEYYHSCTDGFAWHVVSLFDEQQVIEWFRKHGIMPMERDGYLYPRSAQAASVVQVLQRILEEKGVQVHTDEGVLDVIPHRGLKDEIRGYEVITSAGRYLAGQLILASGGAAAPVHGTTGDAYAWMHQMGVPVITPTPALTSLVLEGDYCKIWAGVRIDGQVSVYSDRGECIETGQGEIQMVSYGISGIPVFQVSHIVSRELEAGRRPYLVLDSMYDYTQTELYEELLRRKSTCQHLSLSVADVLEGMLPTKLSSAYIREAGLQKQQKADSLHQKQWDNLVTQIKKKTLMIREVSGFEKAQVTSGGVSLEALDAETMELRQYPGLYITGELADVDGICGGYNLQWAWSSGFVAGRAAAEAAVEMRNRRQTKRNAVRCSYGKE